MTPQAKKNPRPGGHRDEGNGTHERHHTFMHHSTSKKRRNGTSGGERHDETTDEKGVVRYKWEKAFRGVPTSVLGHAEYHVLITLSTWADETGANARPGTSTLSEAADADRATVKKALSKGVALGFLEQTTPGDFVDDEGVAAVYQLTMPAPERLELWVAQTKAKRAKERKREAERLRKLRARRQTTRNTTSAPGDNSTEEKGSGEAYGDSVHSVRGLSPQRTGNDSRTYGDSVPPHQSLTNGSSIAGNTAASSSVSVPASAFGDEADEAAPSVTTDASADESGDACLPDGFLEEDQDHDDERVTVADVDDLDILTTLDELEADAPTPVAPDVFHHLDLLDRITPREEPTHVCALAALDARMADDAERVPTPPARFGELDAPTATTPATPTQEPPAPVSRPPAAATIHRGSDVGTGHHDAPGAALAARRAHGHPAKVQSIAATLGSRLGMPS